MNLKTIMKVVIVSILYILMAYIIIHYESIIGSVIFICSIWVLYYIKLQRLNKKKK